MRGGMARRARSIAVALGSAGDEALRVGVEVVEECEPFGHVRASVGEPPGRRYWR
jgi:hypothetical protein